MVTSIPRPAFGSTIDAALDSLRAALRGDLILAGDPGYDEARKVIDITIDRRPLAIVRAESATDIAEAVVFARDHGLPLAVRSGGHGSGGYSMIDGAVIADLSALKRISVEPGARIARVQAGATSGDLAPVAGAHGLALSTGDTASVGFGGLVTGGGIGFMARKYGLTIDSLLAAQVVTADGDILTASAERHPDLFWAIRGGGGNVGIVTEFVFRLAPVGQILGGELLLPASREVLRGYLDYAATAPDDLTTIANLVKAPPAPDVPPGRIGELALSILVCWTGDPEEGQRALAPLRALATPIADVVGPMPYPALYRFTAHQSAPHAATVRSMFAEALSDDALDAALKAVGEDPYPFCAVQLRALGGAAARVGNEATAFAHRDKPYFVTILRGWMDPAEDPAPHHAWVEAIWGAIRREGSGVYVNFLEQEGAGRVRDAYPPATHARLAAIKRHYDPRNLFRFNQNIAPAAE
jgi:FAD/FMN-containing dehydrogenase